jgi:uncharacterized protein YbjT (DUF2867 family)
MGGQQLLRALLLAGYKPAAAERNAASDPASLLAVFVVDNKDTNLTVSNEK